MHMICVVISLNIAFICFFGQCWNNTGIKLWMKPMELVARAVLKINIESIFIPLDIKTERRTMFSIGDISSSRFRLAINPPVLLIIANQSSIPVLVIIC